MATETIPIDKTFSTLTSEVIFRPKIENQFRAALFSTPSIETPGGPTVIPEIAQLDDISHTHLVITCDQTDYPPLFVAVFNGNAVYTIDTQLATLSSLPTTGPMDGTLTYLKAQTVSADGSWIVGVLDDGVIDPDQMG